VYRAKLGIEHGSLAISMKPSRGRTKTIATGYIFSFGATWEDGSRDRERLTKPIGERLAEVAITALGIAR
jgi:hypothetical protein